MWNSLEGQALPEWDFGPITQEVYSPERALRARHAPAFAPTALRRGLAVALCAKAEACWRVRGAKPLGTKSTGAARKTTGSGAWPTASPRLRPYRRAPTVIRAGAAPGRRLPPAAS